MRACLEPVGVLALIALLLPVAWAQDPEATPSSPAPRHVHGSGIPGLAADEAEELRQGHGMGQARVAEVQGYPGPRHVLDAWRAGKLSLTTEQSVRIQVITHGMALEAQRLGALVLDAERSLALAFGTGGIDPPTLQAGVERITALRGELRLVHLRAHLETRALLGPEQLARYAEIRGHTAKAGTPGPGH
jgi:heavy-metal resistance protein